jgi:hypothetical protein
VQCANIDIEGVFANGDSSTDKDAGWWGCGHSRSSWRDVLSNQRVFRGSFVAIRSRPVLCANGMDSCVA